MHEISHTFPKHEQISHIGTFVIMKRIVKLEIITELMSHNAIHKYTCYYVLVFSIRTGCNEDKIGDREIWT